MKLSFFILLILILNISLVLAVVCPSTNEFDTTIIPCEAITPIIVNCTNFTAVIQDTNNASINQTLNISTKTNGVYNFSFTFSDNSSYLITLCDNSTAVVSVGEYLDFYSLQTYIYIFGAIASTLLLIGGFTYKKEYMVFLGGAMFLVLGLFIWINGIPELDNLLARRGIFMTFMGIGGYFIITAYLGGKK
jgi:hypothetical protein